MKDKKIIYFSVFLAVLIIISIILLTLTFIETGSFEIKADSVATTITLILSVIVVICAIIIIQIKGYEQIAMIKSVEINKFISTDDLDNLQLNLNVYRSVINELNEKQWNKVCEKYYELKQQEEKNKQSQEDVKHNDEITKLKDTILEKLK